MSDKQNIILVNIFGFVFFILMLFSFVVHMFRMDYFFVTEIYTVQVCIIEWLILIIAFFCNYFIPSIDKLWSNQKTVIYSYIKNKYAIWILDPFLSFPIVKSEWTRENWKNLIFRAFVYYIAFQHLCIPYTFYICIFFLIMIVAEAAVLIEDSLYPRKESFDFESLPFPLQQRFYELENPETQARLSKAFSPASLKSTDNKIYVDNLYIKWSENCHMIHKDFNYQDSFRSSKTEIAKQCLTIGRKGAAKCECPEGMLKNIFVMKAIDACIIDPDDFSYALSFIDFSNVKFLSFHLLTLSLNDLKIISTMKLKVASFILLEHETITIHDYLEALAGVPHIKIRYEDECHIPDDFAVNLVKWVLKNGYIESLVISGEVLGEKLVFKSSKEASIHDSFDLI